MRTIVVINPKSGCGQTTTTVNLSAALAKLEYQVLLLDLHADAQAIRGLGIDPHQIKMNLVESGPGCESVFSQSISRTKFSGLDAAWSTLFEKTAEQDSDCRDKNEFVLQNQLDRLTELYDFCVIDCPHTEADLSVNTLVAGQEIVIPFRSCSTSIESLKQLIKTLLNIKINLNPNLKILGLLLTFVEAGVDSLENTDNHLREIFGNLVFEPYIKKDNYLNEVYERGEPVVSYAAEREVAKAYITLAEEVALNLKGSNRITHNPSPSGRLNDSNHNISPAETPRQTDPEKESKNIVLAELQQESSPGQKPQQDSLSDPVQDSKFASSPLPQDLNRDPLAGIKKTESMAGKPTRQSDKLQNQKKASAHSPKMGRPTPDQNYDRRQKKTLVFSGVLFIILMVIISRNYLGTESIPAKSNAAAQPEKNIIATLPPGEIQITWKIPEPFPKLMRDPTVSNNTEIIQEAVDIPKIIKETVNLSQLEVIGIIYKDKKPWALVGGVLVQEKEVIFGFRVEEIKSSSVVFAKEGQKWEIPVR